MRPIIIERGPDCRYRFVCPACRLEGHWHVELVDAERSAARHNRLKHEGEVRA